MTTELFIQNTFLTHPFTPETENVELYDGTKML